MDRAESERSILSTELIDELRRARNVGLTHKQIVSIVRLSAMVAGIVGELDAEAIGLRCSGVLKSIEVCDGKPDELYD